MGLKKDFKSDKPYSGFWGKLYLTPKQRKSLLKWTLYGVLLVVLSLLQDAESGSIFALVASLVYLFSGTAAGPYTMLFVTVLAIGVCIWRQAFLQKGFGAALVCAGTATVALQLLQFLMGLFLQVTIPSRITGFLITAGLSILAIPVLYPIALSIETIGGETWKE